MRAEIVNLLGIEVKDVWEKTNAFAQLEFLDMPLVSFQSSESRVLRDRPFNLIQLTITQAGSVVPSSMFPMLVVPCISQIEC